MNKAFTIKLISLLAMLLTMEATLQSQQPWKRFFNDPPYRSFSYDVLESFDGGYILGGVLKKPNNIWPGWLVKTDINGYVLWTKLIGDTVESPFAALGKTSDNGFILGGRYNSHGASVDAYVMKFDACGSPEWCSFFPDKDGNDSEICNGIHELPDGSYICERYLPIWQQHNRWSLIKIRHNGDLEWMNYYDLNTSWTAQIDISMTLTSDTCFVVNGSVGDTIYGTSGYSWHPFWYKVDNNGNLIWEQKWELSASQSMGDTRKTVEDKYGNYYGGGSMCPPLSFSYLYKLKHDGDTMASYRINDFPNVSSGLVNTLNIDHDTTLVLGTQFTLEHTGYWAMDLTDTLGNIRKTVHELEDMIFVNSLITFDGKYLQLGITGNYPGHPEMATLYKFNSNLEYDSIYTQPRTYDSLCLHAIKSDTIPMPGMCITVNLPEAPKLGELLKLKVSPNPAREYVTVEIPEFSATSQRTGFGTQQQFRPLNGEVQLDFVALNGQTVLSERFDATERNHLVHLDGFVAGMYLIRLSQKGKMVADGKVMVGR